MRASVAVPPIASRRAPATTAPIGMRPTESVRAVAPTRPSRASGESWVRRVRYETRTFAFRIPATNDAPTIIAIGTSRATMTSVRPITTVPTSMTGPTARNAIRAATSEPPRAPTANAERTRPTTSGPRPRSIVM